MKSMSTNANSGYGIPTHKIIGPSPSPRRGRNYLAPFASSFMGAVFMAACIMLWSVAAMARTAPESFADLAEEFSPAVVNISSTQVIEGVAGGPEHFQFPPGSPFEEFFREFRKRQKPDQPRRGMSLGSGFIIDPEGYIVTNNHVIAEAEEITVILQDNTDLKAKIIGRDAKTDLALLKVEAKKKLSAIKWGDSDAARVGDWVMAIGNPFGLGGSVTAGIISARARDIYSGPYDDYIQTDASINRGNSGGPLFNMGGKVIGINTAIFSPSGGSVGIGFAIPSALAQTVIAQLREFGQTRRGWLGVRIQGVTEEIAESFGLDEPKGALIARVNEGEPAEKAGLMAGDVILSFDGKEVSNVRRLQRIVAETPIDKTVKITVWRDEEKKTFDVSVGRLEEFEKTAEAAPGKPGTGKTAKKMTLDSVGLSLSVLVPELRERFELSNEVEGVIVVGVEEQGFASERGMRAGDLIVEVNQVPVVTPEEVKAKIKELVSKKRKTVLFLVERSGDRRFISVPLVEE